MTATETRKRLVIIAVALCISLLIPISQRARSQSLQNKINTQRSVIYGLNEEKISLQAEITKMNTIESIMALGDNVDIQFNQIPVASTMVASN